MYILKNAKENQVKQFRENLIQIKTNPNKDLIATGEADFKTFSVSFDSGLNEVLQYLRNEILMVTRIPPVWVGITDNTNRSSGEQQTFSLESRIKKIQHKIASQLDRELLPKLGFNPENVSFKFYPVSFSDEKTIIENARAMKDMGLKTDDPKEHPAILYLKKHGFKIPVGTKIEDALVVKDEKGFPSRKRENPKTDKVTSNLDEQGVSEEGKEKLEKKKIEARSTEEIAEEKHIELPPSAKYW